jgi:predicted XRE-type DNA-binding protein
MEPTNDYERSISQKFEDKFPEDSGDCHHAIIVEVAASLDFAMSVSDTPCTSRSAAASTAIRKTLSGFGGSGGSGQGFSRRYVPRDLHHAVRWSVVRPSRFPEEIQGWPRDPAAGYRADQATPPCRTEGKKDRAMSKKRKQEGSLNVFKDLGLPNAEEHFIKAQLVFKIDTLMKERDLKQIEAAALLGIKQPDVSKMLRGEFRQFSVERFLHFLVALDQDVEIIVKPHRGTSKAPALHVS